MARAPEAAPSLSSMRVAIDTGGTFTDCVYSRRGRLEILKVFSTPDNPARAIAHALDAIQQSFSGGTGVSLFLSGAEGSLSALDLLHGTTVGTNALLERRGARIALVTTEGFEDVLVIGRQARSRLYDFFLTRPPALVPAARRLGVRERLKPDGRAVIPLTPAALRRLRRSVGRARPEAVAVCLLFSFANSAHERRVARALRHLGVPVSTSHEILPEFREYERTATVAVNAYLVPLMGRYLSEVEGLVNRPSPKGGVGVMQSSGGTISARVAAAQPVRTLLSGPAGGVVGARAVARLACPPKRGVRRRAGFEKAISFDMGGTSTDVALLAGELTTTNEGSVGDVPVAVPMLDIHSVGAGGGSLAWFDQGGALRVGPHSAGADPGPICYGRGRQPTVTDAHLILGRLDPREFLGGEWMLDKGRARRFVQRAMAGRGFRRVEDFAAGILAVANATMERAIRVISVERGHDPREFVLVAFGGAGGLHACALAEALGISQILVPKFPGALSALGILCSDVVKEYSRTLLLPAEGVIPKLEQEFRRMEAAGRAELRRQGFVAGGQRLERRLDLRYRGQAYELTLPYSRGFAQAFHRVHARRYGYADRKRAVEVVNVRLRAVGVTHKPVFRAARLANRRPSDTAVLKRAPVYFNGRLVPTVFYRREELRPGNTLRGPAVVAEYSATTVLPPGWRGKVDAYENLLLNR